MKTVLCFGFLLVLAVTLAQSHPAPNEPIAVAFTAPHTMGIPITTDGELIRHKRATCDLLSIFNVNHSACALHCIAKGYMGGHCNGRAVCVCR